MSPLCSGGCVCVCLCSIQELHNTQVTVLCRLWHCLPPALEWKWKQSGKIDTKIFVVCLQTCWKPLAFGVEIHSSVVSKSYTCQWVLKYPWLVTGHLWDWDIQLLRINNASAMSHLYQSGTTYRQQFHSSNQFAQKWNLLGVLRKVTFRIRLVAQLHTTVQVPMKSLHLQTTSFPNWCVKLIAYDGRISQA